MKTYARERVVLAGVFAGPDSDPASSMSELAELSRSAGGSVVGQIVQRRARGGDLSLGQGKLEELASLCANLKVQVVITQNDLGPLHLRRMEDRLPCRVLDRTGLILDIFAQRALSREGQLQVELAQSMYRLPRLRGKGIEMSRLAGGGRRGLGTRGPGEQKLEYDRRRIRERMSRLKREIEKLRQRRGQQRQRRHDRSMPSVVLAGYTNAGKSTLFNALARADAKAKSQMFTTLDPQVRRLRLPEGGQALLRDTVGFIRDLPADLRVAFRATLEEITDADAVLHVVDASRPDAQAQIESVQGELASIGASPVPVLMVLNKIDALPEPRESAAVLAAGHAPFRLASAKTGEGLADLAAGIEDLLRGRFWERVTWNRPSPLLRSKLRAMGVSMREIGNGEPGSPLEAWLTPAQAAGLTGVEKPLLAEGPP